MDRRLVRAVAWSVASGVTVGAFACFGAGVVASGSMAPALTPGDVLVYRRGAVPCEGEVAVFDRDGWPGGVAHRVIARLPDGRLRLRGDANPIPDREPVAAEAVRGTVVAVVPLGKAFALVAGVR